MAEEFDYEATRKRFPTHWDKDTGWPTVKSTWQSRNYPQMRVRVLETVDAGRDVRTVVFWDGSLDELRGMFTYEPTDRWNIGRHGVVYGAGGIDRDGHWREEGDLLEVVFERPMFGGPDTWHMNFGDSVPPFKPIPDWAYDM